MKQSRYEFCIECREQTEYEFKKVVKKYTIKEKEYDMLVTAAFCKKCGEEIDIPGIMDLRVKEVDEQYRKIENIVTVDEIKKLMDIYNIGKGPLSLALGFGEITITRYINGQMPSKEYSDIIRKALESPDYMIEKLNKNKEKVGDKAYGKALKEANKLKHIFNISDKMLFSISYIFEELNEVTPLALQKLLYFIQGIYMVIFDKPFFEEDCCAWVHGPVYEAVYEIFKTFKYNPIDDNRFIILKNTFHNLDDNETEVIKLVLDTFGMYSGKVLETITHLEEPWIQARDGYLPMEPSTVVIEKDSIKKYFQKVSKEYDLKKEKGINAYINKQIKNFI